MDDFQIAVIGATGAVGKTFLRIMEERNFPAHNIRLCASKRSCGKTVRFTDTELPIEEATPELFNEVDIVFISANGTVSKNLAPIAVRQGALVIDDSSIFRMDSQVPLVVPEINPEDLEHHRGIIAIPNCSTTPLAMVLKPLNDVNPIQRVIVDTYQSVSGTGSAAITELQTQIRQLLEDQTLEPKSYPHQIAFNLLPHIEAFQNNGYTKEEMKMVCETRKILHEPTMAISATCVRVPVLIAHSEALHIELTNPIRPSEARDILSNAPGIEVVDEPSNAVYPMPINAEGRDGVFVGRIRKDLSHPTGIAMWIVSDNLRKGAALNAIQIAEEMVNMGILSKRGK